MIISRDTEKYLTESNTLSRGCVSAQTELTAKGV